MPAATELRLFSTRFHDEAEIRKVIRACHDKIFAAHGLDPAAAFDELLKILVAKLYDELESSGRYRPLQTPDETLANLADVYEEARSRVFGNLMEPGIGLSAETVHDIVELTHEYSFREPPERHPGADVLGVVFQSIVTSTFRGSLGAYFTPRTIAEFIAGVLRPRTGDLVVDPACGTGSLLLATLTSGQRPQLEGMDINSRVARACSLNLWLQGMKPASVRLGDSLTSAPWPKDSIDFVVANPPFAGFETRAEVLQDFASAANGGGKPRSLNKTIPFVEMIIKRLKPGGKAGLVLPTSILNAEESSFKRLRHFIFENCIIMAVIGLPPEAFYHTDCGVAGALLFLQRVESRPQQPYDMFVAEAKTVGYDTLGRPIASNDLISILQEYGSRWPADHTVSSVDVQKDDRLDPIWWNAKNRMLRVVLRHEQPKFIPLASLFDIRRELVDKSRLNKDAEVPYFEVRDTDAEFGVIESVHSGNREQLRRKGRIKQYVRAGDVLLPNHRDSLASAAGGGKGRSAVLVAEEWDGVLTTDRFIVMRPKIDPNLLIWYLNSGEVRDQLVMLSRGSASFDIRESVLSDVGVPDPACLPTEVIADIVSKQIAFTGLRTSIQRQRLELRELATNAAGLVRSGG